MNRILSFIIPLYLILSLSSCEVDLSPDESIYSEECECSLTALAVAGDSLKVRVAYTETLFEDRYEAFEDRSVRLRILMFIDMLGQPEDTLVMAKYRNYLTDTKAEVSAVNDKGVQIPLVFNPNTLDYESDYRPAPGEAISLTATMPGKNGKSVLTAKSRVTVPSWQPQFRIVEVNRFFKEKQFREDLPIEEGLQFTDSVAEITLHIQDPSPDIHCYRLKASGATYNYAYEYGDHIVGSGIKWSSAFFTSDPLLYDSQITDMFGPWQAYTTDVFSNRQFDKDAVVKIQVRYPKTLKNGYRFVQIELQPITTELMNYLSALYRMRVSDNSFFTEYSTLPSNVEGGVGVFGGIGKSTKLRIWLDGDPDHNYPE